MLCMDVRDLRLIASSEDVNIYAPKNSKITFFNSPYPAHQNAEAVDIYFRGNAEARALSPVRGRVERILRYEVGKPFPLYLGYWTGMPLPLKWLINSHETNRKRRRRGRSPRRNGNSNPKRILHILDTTTHSCRSSAS